MARTLARPRAALERQEARWTTVAGLRRALARSATRSSGRRRGTPSTHRASESAPAERRGRQAGPGPRRDVPPVAAKPRNPWAWARPSAVSTHPRIGVLAVQGDVREHLRALEAAGAVATTVRRAAELEQVDGLVVPGGESTTMDKLVRAFDLYEPLRAGSPPACLPMGPARA